MLDNNKIQQISSTQFYGLPTLFELSLVSNHIDSLKIGCLNFVQEEHFFVNFARNKINQLHPDFLNGFKKENLTLNLAENSLATLPIGIFNNHSFICNHS